MTVGAVDGPDHSPDVVQVRLLDDLVARGAPKTVVVADDELEGDLALEVASAGIPLFDGEPRTLEHGDAQALLVAGAAGGDRHRGHDGSDEAHLHRVDVLGLGEGTAGARVRHLGEEVLLEGLHAAERLVVGGRRSRSCRPS